MFPAEVRLSRKKTKLIEEDEGITPCTQEGLAGLRPVIPEGVHTFGAQTHPADGNCAVVVTTEEKAGELSPDSSVKIQVVSYGLARAEKAHMAKAVVPAVKMALEKAGITIHDAKAIKTHNPFAVNDLYLARQMDVDVNGINNYGCSMIFGHPQGPTAGRCIIEGIEEVVMLGGGYLLWGGCAAGDTAAGIVLKID
jgi:acetyl-CoA acetyltransferase